MSLRRLLPLLFVIFLPLSGWAQIIMQGLPHTKAPKANTQKNSNARTKYSTTVGLPFWEDFSDTRTTYADTNRWLYGKSIRVNTGMAIQPPSLGVATFDGIDSVGKPYAVLDMLAKGYADKLISQAIDLTTVPEAQRNTVWLSYMYEMKGNGELPDLGDRLLVQFLDSANTWVPVDTVENNGTIEPDKFYTSFVQVKESKFFHADFKIRFQNFGRLSGPYDTWHLDYIYVNKGRTPGANFNWFPDRTISTPPSSLLGVYTSVPVDHFLIAASDVLTEPRIVITNRSSIQTPIGQPIGSATTTEIAYRIRDTLRQIPTYGPVNNTGNGDLVEYDEFLTLTADKLPDFTNVIQTINDASDTIPDSIAIRVKISLNTKDNVFKPPLDTGDYDPDIFSPIDFRVNDTTSVNYILQNKYSYDDGTAEYGAGLNQPGAQLAYQYKVVGVKSEDITFLEMYFPRFGDEQSRVFELRIWNDYNEDPIYREVTSLQRSADNVMWMKQLTEPVHVDSIFYIGWKQDVAAVIAVGLDKNTDTGDRMFYNVGGGWNQNTSVHGSLMLRPVFGKGSDSPIDGLEDELGKLTVYPNPGSGTFYINGLAQMTSVYDMTGRSIPVTTESSATETKLTLHGANTGIYIIKAYVDGRVKTAKVLVR